MAEEGYEAYFSEQISSAQEALGVGDRKRALAVWAEMHSRFPRLCVQSKATVKLLLDLALFDDAEAILRAGGRRYPGNPQFTLGLAELDQRRGKFEDALRRCRDLRRKFPNNADGYITAAQCLKSLGRLPEADAMLKQAAGRFPYDSEVLIRYAGSAEHRQDWDEAVQRWQVVRGRFDNPSTALGLAGSLRLAGRFADAQEIVTDILLRAPGNHWAHVEMARIAAAKGDHNEESRSWACVRKRAPLHPLGYLEGANAARRAGRDWDAENILADAVKRLESNLDVHLEYVRSAERSGDKIAAQERWALVHDRFPNYQKVVG
ncbi:tetratricopeptide repeat protein [Rhodopila globiformis]|nr:tetratricopeptide repeat protein [Rhodopila globiformis]